MNLSATIAICTYNGEERIGSLFESLVAQTLSPDLWEILVIDNASTDMIAEVCEQWRARLPAPIRVVREVQRGLSYARARAAREAKGEIICFLDDDNVPDPDWVAHAVRFFDGRPKAGVAGGRITPEWEVEPTELVKEVCTFCLAVCDLGDQDICYCGSGGPVGAGLCVRRDLLRRMIAEPCFADTVTGRTAGDLVSGEDLAISVVALRFGYERWYVPAMHIRHKIPKERMAFDYLRRLYNGIGRGQAMARRLYDRKANSPVLSILIGAKDLLRWLRGVVVGRALLGNDEDSNLRRKRHALAQSQIWGRAWQAMPWR